MRTGRPAANSPCRNASGLSGNPPPLVNVNEKLSLNTVSLGPIVPAISTWQKSRLESKLITGE
jgi:hypothetical protein